jgi:N6-adenosine-specific RNA methylase IME4
MSNSRDLSIPDDLLRSAQEFLKRVKAELAASPVETVADVHNECKRWSRLVRASTELRNIYGHADLLIVARIGQLSPRKPAGRPKKFVAYASVKQKYVFSRPTLANYRKVADNTSRIEEYIAKVEKYNQSLPQDERGFCEVTIRGFLAFLEDEELSAARKQVNDIANIKEKEVQGVYDVLVIDPPWPQPGVPYPTMTLEEIQALHLPLADDAHVWIWTTQHFWTKAYDILKGWGLKVGELYVWDKKGGRCPSNRPQQNCEFAIYASKGSPKFTSTKGLRTCFDAKRGEHSEKPECFYEMLRNSTSGRRCDMYNRRAIPGFDGGGNEGVSQQFLDDGTPTWAGDPNLGGGNETVGANVPRVLRTPASLGAAEVGDDDDRDDDGGDDQNDDEDDDLSSGGGSRIVRPRPPQSPRASR